MASEKDNFSLIGPTHLISVDWTNQHHRRTVAASLVQGVYILEDDRQQNRHGTPEALAPPWWHFFHFHLTNVLIDDNDSTIFGAIFKLKSQHQSQHQTSPKYIIAFRGTRLKENSIAQDLKLDLEVFSNTLHKEPRCLLAMKSVQNMASLAGAGHLWLAGHSLGSAIGMIVGKNMAKVGSYIETYLFNPPFITAPLERIKHKKVRDGIRITGSVIKAGLAVALKGTSLSDEAFVALCAWKPYLFVNDVDRICREYIGYFEHRKMMMAIGAEKIGQLATQNSAKSLLFGAMGMGSEALHLLPSANLTINKCPAPNLLAAHGVQEWWRPDIHCHSELHQFKTIASSPNQNCPALT